VERWLRVMGGKLSNAIKMDQVVVREVFLNTRH